MILVCCKTGRFWRVQDHAHGDRRAVRLGLKEYEVGPAQVSAELAARDAQAEGRG